MSSQTPHATTGGRDPIAWMARNAIAANLLMAILVIGGVWVGFQSQKEVFPDFQLDVVTVGVGYPGAAPTEVEQGILRPIEDAVRGVSGIREITSEAREGSGSVSIELLGGTDRMKAFQDVDQAVSRIRTFPDDIEQPEVSLRSRQREVMSVVLYGPIDIWTLRQLGEQLRDRLLSDENITEVEINRASDYVTHVEVPRHRLREYGLTLADVARLIESSAEDVAAGSVEAQSGEVLLRVKSRKQWAEEFADIEVVATASGSALRLGDLATIRDGFEEENFHSQFNQTPSVELEVYRVGRQSPMDVAGAVDAIMPEFEASLPPGVTWRIDNNAADEFRQRLSLVMENGVLAVFIVLVILALFLEIRLAFWVMMGMVISFIGGLLFLPMAGVSINMISLFGFLVVLGIVVDDAIVVGENVYEHRLAGASPLRAAIDGTREMAGPVTFSIASNVVAFVPLMFIPGETGKFWAPLPVVVIIVLLISLFEALFILPAHLAHLRAGKGGDKAGGQAESESDVDAKPEADSQADTANAADTVDAGTPPPAHEPGTADAPKTGLHLFARAFNAFLHGVYRPFLDLCLRYRYVTSVAAVSLFLVVGGYAMSAHMGMILMPQVSADEIEAGVRLPVGTTPDQANRIAQEVTAASMRMFEEHDLDAVAEGIKTNVRRGSFVDVEIVMRPPDERDMTADEVIELWREAIGDLRGVTQISFEAESGPGGWRQDISVDLSHSDIDTLEKASMAFVERMEGFANTRDVNDNYNKGKTQYDVRLLPEGRALGLTAEDVGEQLRGAFFGSLALRLMRGTNEVEVRVKLPEHEREDTHHLENLVIRTPSGAEVPLLDVAEITASEAFTSINRRNGRRVVNVSMDVEPKRAVGQVITAITEQELPALRADYPGLTWTFEGSNAEMRESTAELWGGFGFAMIVIYMLLAVAFGSYTQPLVVLVAIPFGIIGAVTGHMLLGYDLSLISLMGVVALSGVVVNDSLIMVDHANRQRLKRGASAFAAIREAGVRRLRPILLTTLTTFGGLMPIIFEPSLQAQYIIPMAISLGFGILFSTAIILVLVPCLYLILDDLHWLAAPVTPNNTNAVRGIDAPPVSPVPPAA